MGLQPGPALHRRVALALPAVRHVQATLQVGRRLAGRRLGPPLADPLRTLDHAVGLRATRRVGRDGDPQPGQPADQVGGQVAARPPGRAVVDPQPFGQAPPPEEPSQGGLGPAGINPGPAAEEGKRPSSGWPRSPRRRLATNSPSPGPSGRSARRRRPARSGGVGWPGPLAVPAASRRGPAPGRPGGAIARSSGGGARRPRAAPRPRPPGPAPQLGCSRRLARAAPAGSPRGWRGPAWAGGDSRERGRPRPARETASRGDGRCEAASRRRSAREVTPSPCWARSQSFWRIGTGTGTTSVRDGGLRQHPPISPHQPTHGKTSDQNSCGTIYQLVTLALPRTVTRRVRPRIE